MSFSHFSEYGVKMYVANKTSKTFSPTTFAMTDNVIIKQYTVIHPFEIAHRKTHTHTHTRTTCILSQLLAGNKQTKKVQLPHHSTIICHTFVHLLGAVL